MMKINIIYFITSTKVLYAILFFVKINIQANLLNSWNFIALNKKEWYLLMITNTWIKIKSKYYILTIYQIKLKII